MSIDSSLADVMSRISAIQSQLAAMSPQTAPSSTDTADTAASTTDATTSFSDALSSAATGTGSSTGTSSAGTAAAGSGAAPAPTASAGRTGAMVVADAKKYLGIPYVWGGTDPAKGLDCSGLVQRVFADLGISMPRVSYDQARQGKAVSSLATAKPGDLLAFGSPVHHVAIYLGGNMMLEAPRPGKNVQITSVYETPTAIRRIVPDAASAGAVTTATPVTSSATPSITGTFAQRMAAMAPIFAAAERKYSLPAGVLAAVAQVESSCRTDVVSPKGAIGIMQIMPATAKALGVDPHNPTQAVDGAARLLRGGLNEFGSLSLALAGYNAGDGAVRHYGGIPPYAETQAYVKNVLALMKRSN
jgi:cell wall-associated NlpC family hydrolase